jgi:hypothetical protein
LEYGGSTPLCLQGRAAGRESRFPLHAENRRSGVHSPSDFVVSALEATPRLTNKIFFWSGIGKLESISQCDGRDVCIASDSLHGTKKSANINPLARALCASIQHRSTDEIRCSRRQSRSASSSERKAPFRSGLRNATRVRRARNSPQIALRSQHLASCSTRSSARRRQNSTAAP